jgi:SurA N-terminal domain/PPIC-type PPIASE domain
MTKKRFSLKKGGKAGRFITPRVKRKQATSPSEGAIPRITNETVSQHREEVLSGARKYIYPLKHSRHRVVLISVTILMVVFITFMSYTLVSLYKQQSTSAFMHQVTKVVPLPIARVGGKFISYENYLFELRRYIHYYENQQDVDFSDPKAKSQLDEQRKKALEKVVNQAYIQKIAREKNVTVSSAEIDAQIETLREQSRLGNDSRVFEDVLKDYWGWTVADFRRSIANELLAQKVLAAVDTQTRERANGASAQLTAGKDFAIVAKENSDDLATKDRGGELGILISKTDRSIPAQTTEALFNLKPGEVSGVIDVGSGLEIVKNLGFEGDKVKAAIIFFKYQELDTFLNNYREKQPATVYIRL